VALGGLGSAIAILVSTGVLLALVEAAHEGRGPAAVRALFELDEIVFIVIAWTSAAFYTGAALSSLATSSLPRWLGWLAALLAAVFVLAFLSIFSEDDEGGVLGAISFLALLVNFIWILAASIVLLREDSAE
jgi:hypothetical protein